VFKVADNVGRLCDVAVLDAKMFNTPPKPNSSNNVQ